MSQQQTYQTFVEGKLNEAGITRVADLFSCTELLTVIQTPEMIETTNEIVRFSVTLKPATSVLDGWGKA